MKIKEFIVVEGRDDTAALKRTLNCNTIETHGFGISRETWAQLQTAYEGAGIIIFTDPDHSGEEIRKKLGSAFPLAKHAWLTRDEATVCGDIGIENAQPHAICEALQNARCVLEETRRIFSMKDLKNHGLTGSANSAKKRQHLGKKLGIGYGNSKSFLNKLNAYGISRQAFLAHLEEKGR